MMYQERPWASGASGTAHRTACWSMLVGVALVLAACATRVAPPATEVPIVAAQRTLAVGFQQLSERYVEYVPVGTLAFEGIRGLSIIDPAFAARRDDGRIVFSVEGGPHHVLPLPADTDADGWATIAVDVLRHVKHDSRALAEAPLERVYEAVFDGSLSLLDAYSRYSGAEEASRNRERRSGFGGIGIVVRGSRAGAVVAEVYIDSPAMRAGLAQGDIITHVDGQLVSAGSLDSTEFVRGPIGSPVTLRIARAGVEPFNVDLRRQRVLTPTVYISTRNDVITARITGFNRRTTRHLATQLAEAIHGMDGAARGVILDLRGNPGGLLSEAIKVADLFIPEGRILSTLGRHPASVHDYDAREDDVADGLPVVVIVNGRSASASEIVAAALQDHERAIIVGSSSYGKGTVQTDIPLPNEGELTVTWSRFVTPSGYTLNGLGVRPSVCTNTPAATAEQLLTRAVESGQDLIQMFRAWRGVDRAGADRKRLKALCPSSDTVADVDGAIAETLIADQDLYHRVISFAPSMASMEK